MVGGHEGPAERDGPLHLLGVRRGEGALFGCRCDIDPAPSEAGDDAGVDTLVRVEP